MREQFPYFEKSPLHSDLERPIYLDNAATTQKLRTVIERTCEFYSNEYATVNRSSYPLANRASRYYEEVRQLTADLINAESSAEVIFTSGATQSLNIVASGLRASQLNGSKLVILESEHHANLLPWQQLCKRHNLNLCVIKLAEQGTWTQEQENNLLNAIDEDTAIVAMAHVSNLLGNIYPVEKVCIKARRMKALSIIDGTQAIAHLHVDVKAIGCDCYVFSSHKMYGPTGLGILYCRFSLAENLYPSQFGGEMITDVTFEAFDMQPPPLKFETGTGNIAAIIGFKPAVLFLAQHIANIIEHERALYEYALAKICQIQGVQVLGNRDNSIGIISFIADSYSIVDIANALYQQNIACRVGTHCAIPLMKGLGLDNCIRLSIGCYNNEADIDEFSSALANAIALNNDKISTDQDLNQSSLVDYTLRELTLATKVLRASSWDNKHRQLLLASKQLSILDVDSCSADAEVLGCETQVWILRKNGLYQAQAKSKIIKGILAILFEKADSLSNDSLLTFDFFDYLHSLGLAKYFSSGRKDGISNAIKRIKDLA